MGKTKKITKVFIRYADRLYEGEGHMTTKMMIEKVEEMLLKAQTAEEVARLTNLLVTLKNDYIRELETTLNRRVA